MLTEEFLDKSVLPILPKVAGLGTICSALGCVAGVASGSLIIAVPSGLMAIIGFQQTKKLIAFNHVNRIFNKERGQPTAPNEVKSAIPELKP